jgi:uncharacterized repeat protein (TIGR03803 family)
MIHQSILGKLGLSSALLMAWACMPRQVRGGGLTALASFNRTNGANPYADVTLDANGNLYGTAAFGGAGPGGSGTVWELAKGSGTITALASFNGTNGSEPFAGVTFDANVNLYGTANGGGASGLGTVWEFQPSSVPEPSSLVLGWIGLALAPWALRRFC